MSEAFGRDTERTLARLESADRGKHVGMVFAFVRHGRRTDAPNQSDTTGTTFEKRGSLTHEGRAEARMQALRESMRPGSVYSIDFDHIYTTGSTAGPAGQTMEGKSTDMQRAYETAHIHATALESLGQGTLVGQGASDALSYATLVSEPPYDHEGIYTAALQKAEEDGLSPIEAEQAAQNAAIEAEFASLTHADPTMRKSGERFFREVAGSFAVLLFAGQEKMRGIESGTTLFVPAGTHGGTMECLLAMTLEWDDENGRHHGPGFTDIRTIGGAFMTSEGYSVELETDHDGLLNGVRLSFQQKEKRPGIFNAQLNMQKLAEAAEFYRSLHPEMPSIGIENLHV